ncbi:MAG: CHRD domain-containing protein [Thaumarchaeota archaeon]|nr:CHRD domain-containing protein [Nitrososphaerota archaeon]
MISGSNQRIRALGVVGFAALLCTFAIGVLPVHAATGLITCTATLTGANEVPPAVTQATGTITFTFDQSTSTSTWSETFAGLTAPATAAHIHAPAPPGSNTGVVVPFTGVPSATSGSYSGTTTTLNAPFNIPGGASAFAAALLGGMAYANIHTSTNPGGEIRGWLSCSQPSGVPEFPLSLGAFAIVGLLVPVLLLLRRTTILTK